MSDKQKSKQAGLEISEVDTIKLKEIYEKIRLTFQNSGKKQKHFLKHTGKGLERF